MNDVIFLAQKLIGFKTINPPGNEYDIAHFIGNLLNENGFMVKYIPFEEKRVHVVAEKGLSREVAPIVFTGHFDTVPLGEKEWAVDPFGGEVKNGKLYGRGSSDMKGAVAAMVIAAIQSFKENPPPGGVRLILTAAEELGCCGAKDLVTTYNELGKARGLIVGEPTGNMPGIGHKGGVYLNITASGKAAHSSMPHLGSNAIYKAARAILMVERLDLKGEEDNLLGFPTINVGKVFGGQNLNSVPDSAGFTIDLRTTTNTDHKKFYGQLQKELGDEIAIDILVDLPAVASDEDDPFVQKVYGICGITKGDEGFPLALPYLTDGSVLQPAYNYVPTVIIGPGQPEMAHQTDEFCYTVKLIEAVNIYREIISKYRIDDE